MCSLETLIPLLSVLVRVLLQRADTMSMAILTVESIYLELAYNSQV